MFAKIIYFLSSIRYKNEVNKEKRKVAMKNYEI